MKKVSIVILNWNGSKMMRRYLPSVIEHSKVDTDVSFNAETECCDVEVVVADNGSTDDSIEMLTKEFPSVRRIVLDKNYGFAEGYNKAFEHVDSEYAVLLNSDVEVTEGWLSPLVSFMDKNKDVAACQPKLLADTDRERFEYAGAAGGYLDRYGYPFCRGRIFNTVEKDYGQYDSNDAIDVLWATGACLMVRLEDYRNAGGLDGRFFAHNEEIDLCWRLRLYGKRVVCITESKVYHLGGGTLPQGNPRKTYLNFRNNLTMLYKNLPEKELGNVMTMRLFLDYVAALQALLTGNMGDVKAIYKARCDFKKWKHEYRQVREDIQKKTICHDIKERTQYSILWEYYVRRNKIFSSIY